MTEHYSNLLRSVVAAVDQQVGSLNMLSATEQKELEQFNETTTEYPKRQRASQHCLKSRQQKHQKA